MQQVTEHHIYEYLVQQTESKEEWKGYVTQPTTVCIPNQTSTKPYNTDANQYKDR